MSERWPICRRVRRRLRRGLVRQWVGVERDKRGDHGGHVAVGHAIQGRVPAERIFLNRYGRPITRFGTCDLVTRYVRTAVSPHTIGRSTATHLLRGWVDINTVCNWLGHVSVEKPRRGAFRYGQASYGRASSSDHRDGLFRLRTLLLHRVTTLRCDAVCFQILRAQKIGHSPAHDLGCRQPPATSHWHACSRSQTVPTVCINRIRSALHSKIG